MGSSVSMMFKHYIELDIEAKEALRYHQIGHPRRASYADQPSWIPRGFFKAQEDAEADVALIPVDEPPKIAQRRKRK
jgi:hypothetical protein